MKPSQVINLFDSMTGAKLLTANEAATYLQYHPVSIRRLVSRKDLRPHTRAGKTLLFLREELERFKMENPWASRKAKIRIFPNPPPTPYPNKVMQAVVTLKSRGKERAFSRIKVFHWEDIPLIRSRIDQKHGNVPFRISIQSPDGAGWELSYYSSCIELDQYRELNRSKRGHGIPWLVG